MLSPLSTHFSHQMLSLTTSRDPVSPPSVQSPHCQQLSMPWPSLKERCTWLAGLLSLSYLLTLAAASHLKSNSVFMGQCAYVLTQGPEDTVSRWAHQDRDLACSVQLCVCSPSQSTWHIVGAQKRFAKSVVNPLRTVSATDEPEKRSTRWLTLTQSPPCWGER